METEKQISANMWGWRWSWISLGIILVGLFFLVFVGPNEVEGTETNEIERVDSLNVNMPK